jgi:uncharacterized protein YbbC (DUF1343 family)
MHDHAQLYAPRHRAAPIVAAALASALVGAACTSSRAAERGMVPSGRVRPGITVLLEDSIHLVRGKRIGLLTNQTGLDEGGRSDIDLLASGERARAAGVRLVTLFSPEHGIRGTEDRTNIASGVDERTGLPIISLYTTTTIAPPDSALRGLDALVFDLQDIGTRTWTYVGSMLYAMRAARRNGIPFVVLDRPNPITGEHADGPMLDSALANSEDPSPEHPGRAYALYPFPLRHAMTMGEMARYYNEELSIGADLHVIPAKGWRRAMWYDQTGLPWVKPSPNMPSLTSALIYPALVALEATNVSVGRGTAEAFQRFGAPWLAADSVAALLNERDLGGVRFESEAFTPRAPTDRKYDGLRIPGVRIVVTSRERVQPGRIGAAILWALARTARDSLRISALAFDLRFGSTALRERLMRGDDPDAVLDSELPAVVAFQERARRYWLYR